jgi:hypothetical protein
VLQLLPCPHCGQQSLLPHDTSLEASLKCPHCGQQLVLGEALLLQFSSWEIVDDPAILAESQGSSSQLSKPVVIPVPLGDSPHEELHLVQAPTATSDLPAPKVSVRPDKHFRHERMRRIQKKSPLWNILPVVLGGVAAFPIALIILWHGLGKDVGDMGKKVAEYAPWIVPEQFHPVSKTYNPALRRQPLPGESGLPQLGNLAPKPTPAPSLPPAEEPRITTMNADVGKGVGTTSDTHITPSAEGKLELVTAAAAEPEPDSATSTSDSMANQDLFSVIRETKEQLVQLEKAMQSAAPDKVNLVVSLYDRLKQLAVGFGSVDKDSPIHRTIVQQMQPIARIIKQNSEIQSVLDRFLVWQLGQENASAEPTGVAMTLEVSEVERLQELWKVAGKHKLSDNTVIEIPRALAPTAFTTGQKLLVLGVIVPADPQVANAVPLLRVSYLHSL